MSVIVTYNLTKDFDMLRAVDSLSIRIQEGEIFSLLGPNGAGKTTTVRMLAGLLVPTFGSATVLGHDILLEAQEIRERIGYLTETPGLYERLTVKKNLAFFGKLYNVPTEDLDNRIELLLELFDLKEKKNQPAGSLSKGMKQKVAIARALLHNPDLLFLDEPTSSLSPEAAMIVRKKILELAKQEKRTFVICTHNLYEAELLSTRVAIMNKGKIVAIGKPNELKTMLIQDSYIQVRLKKLEPAFLQYFKDKNIELLSKVPEKQVVNIKISDIENTTPIIVRDLVNLGAQIIEVKYVQPSLEKIYLELINEGADSNEIV
ncbi:MAG: ABC transporter ATP-binding protein [Candidatus Heimdallarchaeaceae archaeon]